MCVVVRCLVLDSGAHTRYSKCLRLVLDGADPPASPASSLQPSSGSASSMTCFGTRYLLPPSLTPPSFTCIVRFTLPEGYDGLSARRSRARPPLNPPAQPAAAAAAGGPAPPSTAPTAPTASTRVGGDAEVEALMRCGQGLASANGSSGTRWLIVVDSDQGRRRVLSALPKVPTCTCTHTLAHTHSRSHTQTRPRHASQGPSNREVRTMRRMRR